MLSQLKLQAHRRLFVSLLLFLCVGGCEPPSILSTNPSNPNPTTITRQDPIQPFIILFDNDTHGHILTSKQGEYGLASRKTLVDRRRAYAQKHNIPLLYFSGGDVNTGTAESSLLKAEVDFKAMNLLGIDAMVLGNHEFDNPLSVLRKQASWANFPFLSANIFDKKTGQRAFQSYAIFEQAGLKVAVFGLTTMDTLKTVKPGHVRSLEFRDPIAVARKLVPDLRKKADIVIALTHLGHYPDENHGSNSPGDVTLARQVPGIDIVIGGHTQTAVCMLDHNQINHHFQPGDPCKPDIQNGTIIVQANEWGKYLGELHIHFDRRDRKVKLVSNQLIPINMQRKEGTRTKLVNDYIPQDPEMKALIGHYMKKIEQFMNEPLTSLDIDLKGDRATLRNQQSPLGQIFVESLIQASHADVGLFNGGGLRDGLNKGWVTYKDIFAVHPFGNTMSYIDLSGQELTNYLEALATKQFLTGGFPHFRGVEFSLDKGKISNLVVYGQKRRTVVANETYRLVFNDFLAGGGDMYPYLASHTRYVETAIPCVDVVRNYLKSIQHLEGQSFTPRKYLRTSSPQQPQPNK